MIKSKVKFYILLFKQNELKPNVLLDTETYDVPSLDIKESKTMFSIIENLCKKLGISQDISNFKIVDCQVNENILEICYYTILPFGYSDPSLKFVDIVDIDISKYPNLQKTIYLL